MRNEDTVREVLETFANGTPVSEEIPLADGVWLSFDHPYEDDLREYTVPAVLCINQEEYPDFDPEKQEMYDLDTFEEIDVKLLRIFNDVFSGVSNAEYNDTENGIHHFYYIIDLDNF